MREVQCEIAWASGQCDTRSRNIEQYYLLLNRELLIDKILIKHIKEVDPTVMGSCQGEEIFGIVIL